MSDDHAKTDELKRNADRIRRSLHDILTKPKDLHARFRQPSFGAIASSGGLRPDMTEHAVQLSACHVIGEREPRVKDVVVTSKLKQGKLVSMAVSYTIKASKERDKIAIAY